jgi:hypothetical protein
MLALYMVSQSLLEMVLHEQELICELKNSRSIFNVVGMFEKVMDSLTYSEETRLLLKQHAEAF